MVSMREVVYDTRRHNTLNMPRSRTTPPRSQYVGLATGEFEDDSTGKDREEQGSCWPGVLTLNTVAMVSHFVMAWAVLGVCIWKDAAHKCVPITNTFNEGRPGGFGNTSGTETLPGVGICYGFLAFAFELVCFLAHAWVRYYEDVYIQRILPSMLNPWRWLEYSVSSSLMVVAVATVSGSHAFGAILGYVGCNVGTMYTGLWSEMANRERAGDTYMKSAKPTWTPFVVGCVLQVFVWIGILTSYGASVARQIPPWFVHAFVIQVFIAFNSFAVVEALWISNYITSYASKEWYYMFLSLSSKLILSSFVIGSLM